jgi:hypothetical protein
MAAKQKPPAAIALERKDGKQGNPAPSTQRGRNGISGDARGRPSAASRLSPSKQALHLCLRRLKNAKDESEVRRLTEELQRIVFHRQYRNAEN